MLVDYEYELLSYVAGKSIGKSKDIIFVSSKYIMEIDENINIYLNKLKDTGIIEINHNGIDIYINKWIELFSKLLNNEFKKYKLNIECHYEKKYNSIIFESNNSIKEFDIVIVKENKIYEKDVIFMCQLNLCIGDVFWMSLLNDYNKLHMFYLYLMNEISKINQYRYRDINIFEGIEDTHLSEIFNVSIKKYFKKKGITTREVTEEIKLIVKYIIEKNEINCYSVNLGENTLITIKDHNIIKFITVKDNSVIYSKEAEDIIDDIKQKLTKKVSEYRQLNMFKNNNIIENANKLTDGAIKLFLPLVIAINILGLTINIDVITVYKHISYFLVGVLLIIQAYIFKLIYMPAFRLSRFKWDI